MRQLVPLVKQLYTASVLTACNIITKQPKSSDDPNGSKVDRKAAKYYTVETCFLAPSHGLMLLDGVGTKPGLWTLDWTMDWTMDRIMDSILDSK